LPGVETVQWLSFMLFVARKLNMDKQAPGIAVETESKKIVIRMECEHYLAQESLSNVKAPNKFQLAFVNSD
jgi:hypothetical protein